MYIAYMDIYVIVGYVWMW